MSRFIFSILAVVLSSQIAMAQHTVQSGSEIVLGSLVVFNQSNCEHSAAPLVRIVQPPQNGTATIRRVANVPTQNTLCPTLTGPALIYRSRPGYVGPDQLVISMVFSSNTREQLRDQTARQFIVRINVTGSARRRN